MHRKILFIFILLSFVCFSILVVSGQIVVSSSGPFRREDFLNNSHIERTPYVGFEHEKKRLDLTARLWKYNTDQEIQLIIFGAKQDKRSKADALGDKAARYLADTHKIPGNKITIITVHLSGREMEMDIYLINEEDDKKTWLEKLSKIKVGVSTKSDFEKAFPPYDVESTQKLDWKNEVIYETYEGDAIAVYSKGKCSDLQEIYCPICKKPPNDLAFDLPKDTIISIKFEPFYLLKFLELNLDISQSKIKQGVKTNTWVYTNEDSGTNYGITDDAKLDFVSFDLSKDQKQNLKCSNQPIP